MTDYKITDYSKPIEFYYINDVNSDYNNVLLTYGNKIKTVRFSYGLEANGAASCKENGTDWGVISNGAFDYLDNKRWDYYEFS